MQRTKEEIIDYFQEYVFGFICHDIERCIEARANYVVALALLSYTEFIGGLISGNLGLSGKSPCSFEKALKYFPPAYETVNASLKMQFEGHNGKKQTETGIYKLLRCGMVHEYFTKGNPTTICNNPDGDTKDDRIGIQVSQCDSGKRLEFYTNEYFRDFRLAVKKIYKSLVVDDDRTLLEGFNKSLDRISSRKIV